MNQLELDNAAEDIEIVQVLLPELPKLREKLGMTGKDVGQSLVQSDSELGKSVEERLQTAIE